MKTLLAVSPHLDDATFSAGALLARHAAAGWRVVVATCFTASVPNPTGFALACQVDKGFDMLVDYMALRRSEDQAACAAIGAEPVHLDLPEAPHRGYDSVPALFGGRLEIDAMAETLSGTLRELIENIKPDWILGPASIGDHVDHWIVRDSLPAEPPCPVRLWADLPYAARSKAAIAAGGERIACGAEFDRKLVAARSYQSQLRFQFEAEAQMPALLSLNGDELFWPSDALPSGPSAAAPGAGTSA